MIQSCIYEYMEKTLSQKRKDHTYAVIKEASTLALRWAVDVEKAEIAALCHDLFRNLEEFELNQYVETYQLGEKYLNNPNLAHGRIAAIFIEKEFGIHDQDILNAVKYHTTGRAHMSDLEKVIYLADAIEPNRKYAFVEELRDLTYWNLEEACLLSFNHMIDYVITHGNYLDENTLFARDSIKKELERRGK